MPKITEGDTVTIKAEVTRVSDDGEWITVWISGQRVGAPVTMRAGAVEGVQKQPKRRPIYDKPD